MCQARESSSSFGDSYYRIQHMYGPPTHVSQECSELGLQPRFLRACARCWLCHLHHIHQQVCNKGKWQRLHRACTGMRTLFVVGKTSPVCVWEWVKAAPERTTSPLGRSSEPPTPGRSSMAGQPVLTARRVRIPWPPPRMTRMTIAWYMRSVSSCRAAGATASERPEGASFEVL